MYILPFSKQKKAQIAKTQKMSMEELLKSQPSFLSLMVYLGDPFKEATKESEDTSVSEDIVENQQANTQSEVVKDNTKAQDLSTMLAQAKNHISTLEGFLCELKDCVCKAELKDMTTSDDKSGEDSAVEADFSESKNSDEPPRQADISEVNDSKVSLSLNETSSGEESDNNMPDIDYTCNKHVVFVKDQKTECNKTPGQKQSKRFFRPFITKDAECWSHCSICMKSVVGNSHLRRVLFPFNSVCVKCWPHIHPSHVDYYRTYSQHYPASICGICNINLDTFDGYYISTCNSCRRSTPSSDSKTMRSNKVSPPPAETASTTVDIETLNAIKVSASR